MSQLHDQWIRKVNLTVHGQTIRGNNPSATVFDKEGGLDLSKFRIRFQTVAADVESPNSCSIRVYNLAPSTVKQIKGEFSSVTLSAGYESGNYGIIFQGFIKQFRTGRENETDTYLDILAADGDIGYNQGVIRESLRAGVTPEQAIKATVEAMATAQPGMLADLGSLRTDKQHVPALRGQVMFGMARARLRNMVTHLDAGWSIQNGVVVVTDNTGYREGEIVSINVGTGLIGLPQQTDAGIQFTSLMNSRIRTGCLVQLDNSSITELSQQSTTSGPIAYNSWVGLQHLAPLSPDGKYRALVVEHEGDTRGHHWYTNITGLAFDDSARIDPETNLPMYVLRN